MYDSCYAECTMQNYKYIPAMRWILKLNGIVPSSRRPKNVSGFLSPRASPQTRASAFLLLFLGAMKRCPIAAKIAGLIGNLPRCVLNDFFTQGYERLPNLYGELPPHRFQADL